MRRNRLRVNLNWTAEAKVILILFYFLVLAAVVIAILTYSLVSTDDFFETAVKYFTCEDGVASYDEYDTMAVNQSSPCEQLRGELRSLINPIPTVIAFVLLGLYPLMDLVYVINIKELKKKFALKKRKVEVINKSREDRMNVQSAVIRATPINFGGGGRGGGGGMNVGGGLINFNAAAANFSPGADYGHKTSSFSSAYTRPSTFEPLLPANNNQVI